MKKRIAAVFLSVCILFCIPVSAQETQVRTDWFENDKRTTWWATDSYKDGLWRYTITVDDSGWHYTTHSKLADAGTAASYSTGFAININETPELTVKYTTDANSILKLRLYAFGETGGVTGDPVFVEIGVLKKGSGTLNIQLMDDPKIVAAVGNNNGFYASGVEFTTTELKEENTVTISDFYFGKTAVRDIIGDLNGDGKRNEKDISTVKSVIIEKETSSKITDYNSDGTVVQYNYSHDN